MSIQYTVQPKPDGLAQAFLIGAKFLASGPAALVLGDNLFHGHELITQLRAAAARPKGGTVFAYPVRDPERYGVVEFDDSGTFDSLQEAGAYIRTLEQTQRMEGALGQQGGRGTYGIKQPPRIRCPDQQSPIERKNSPC